jgi:hypothetical protein
MYTTHRDQKLTRGSPLAHCEPVTMVTPACVGQPQTEDVWSRLEDIVTGARPHLTKGKIKGFYDVLTEYEYIFAEADENNGRINIVYHRIGTGYTRPIRQPPTRIPVANLANVK